MIPATRLAARRVCGSWPKTFGQRLLPVRGRACEPDRSGMAEIEGGKRSGGGDDAQNKNDPKNNHKQIQYLASILIVWIAHFIPRRSITRTSANTH